MLAHGPFPNSRHGGPFLLRLCSIHLVHLKRVRSAAVDRGFLRDPFPHELAFVG